MAEQNLTTTPKWRKQVAHARGSSAVWWTRFAENVRSARAFVKRRAAMRTALKDRRLPWRRFVTLGALAVLFLFAVFDPLAGVAGSKAYGRLLTIAYWTTDAGKSGWYIWPLAIALIVCLSLDWSRWPQRAKTLLFYRTSAIAFALTAIAGSGIIVNLFKNMLGRARPRVYDEFGAFHFEPFTFDYMFASFPSGHSTTFGAVCACAALLFPRLRTLFLILAVWFASTRIVVGAHFPSDVMGGLLFGGWFSWWVGYRFAKAGLVFDLPEGNGIVPKRSFHLVELARHRRISDWVDRTEVRLRDVAGLEPPARKGGKGRAIDS